MSGDDRLRAPPVPQRREPAVPTAELIPPAHGGLLARLDILVNLIADRRGLALDLSGRMTAAEARLVAQALELTPPRGPDAADPSDPGGAGGSGEADGPPSPRDLAAVELLRALAQAIGLVRDRGDRIEATTLRHPWRQLDPGLRAGLVYAAWCQQVTFCTPSFDLARQANPCHPALYSRSSS